MPIEQEGMYQCSRINRGVATPLDYKWLVRGSSDEKDKHSAIVLSFSSISNKDSEAMVNMADLLKKVSKIHEK